MMVPVDYEEIATNTSTAVSLTAAKVAALGNVKSYALITVYGYPIAVRFGTAPTSATLQQWAVGGVYRVDERIGLSLFQAIAIGGAGNIAVQYFKRR